MGSKGKSTSTERLLQIIRGGASAGQAGAEGGPKGDQAAAAETTARGRTEAAVREAVRKVKVGVDLGPYSLTLVKMVGTGGQFQLLGFHQYPYPSSDVSFKSPEFTKFLRECMTEFCNSARGAEVWTLVSSANAELWHMRIPKVPARQVPDAVYWAAKKEKQFDDAQFILDFEIQGKVMDKGVEKFAVMAYVVPRGIVEERKVLFEAAGFPLTGATISPIALQTLFRAKWVPNTAKVWANIFVGRNWSRIDVFDRGDLVMSRAVKAGTNSMTEAFHDAYNERVETLAAAAAKVREEQEAAAAASGAGDAVTFAPAEADGLAVELEVDLPELVFEGLPGEGESPGGGPLAGEPGPGADEPGAGTGSVPEPGLVLELDLDEEQAAPAPIPPVQGQAPGPERVPPSLPDNTQFVLEGEERPAGLPELSPIDVDQAKRVLYHKLLGRPLGQDRAGADLSDAEVFDLALPAVERLVRQMERSFDHYVEVQGNDRIERLFFSGDICTNPRLMDYVDTQLGLESQLLDPLDPEIPWLTGMGVPESSADRLNYNLVAALALCDNAYTPNLLYTYKDKENARRVAFLAKVIYASAGVLLALLAGLYLWNNAIVRARTADLEARRAALAAFSPQVDQMILLQMAAKAKGANQDLHALARRYEGLAVLRELAGLTPENVRLLAANLDMGPPPARNGDKPGAKGPAKDQVAGRLLVIDGFVSGEAQGFEAALASYLVRLENSPLFGPPMVHKRTEENLGGQGRVLRFVLHVVLG